MSADVVVIGAGIIGCASAHALACAGLKVSVIDPHPLGTRAATRYAAGMLGAQLEDHADEAMLRLCVDSREAYPSWLEELEAGDVEHARVGALQVAFDDGEADILRRRVERHRGLDLPAHHLDGAAARERLPLLSPDVVGAAWLPADGIVEPRELLDAVHRAAVAAGVTFRFGERAAEVRVRGGRVVGVELAGGLEIACGAAVVAAGSWSSQIAGAGLSPDAVRPVRGQIVRLRLDEPLPSIVDTPGVYLSPRADGRLLVGATVERVGFAGAVTVDAVRTLLDRACRVVPSLAEAAVDTAWWGFRPETSRHLPLLGPGPAAGLVLATGHYRNGIVLAPVTARIVRALVLGEAPPVDLGPFLPPV